jgi:hypothetical protein
VSRAIVIAEESPVAVTFADGTELVIPTGFIAAGIPFPVRSIVMLVKDEGDA